MKSAFPPTPVTLYSYVMSPYAAKVHCFLLYKHVLFECFYINPLRVPRDLPLGRQIPVLAIGAESRADSTRIGLWLDERFPDLPRLLPENAHERKLLLEVDDWVTNHLIPGSFRFFPGEGLDRWLNGWRLSAVMDKTARGGLPIWLRAAWPFFIKRVGFIRRLIEIADDGLSLRQSKLSLFRQFIAHLDGGPFLAGRSAPSLPDLAAYPQFALYYLTGFRGSEDILEYPQIVSWLRRMAPYVAGTPALVPTAVRMRGLP